jgi:hypothetical protein
MAYIDEQKQRILDACRNRLGTTARSLTKDGDLIAEMHIIELLQQLVLERRMIRTIVRDNNGRRALYNTTPAHVFDTHGIYMDDLAKNRVMEARYHLVQAEFLALHCYGKDAKVLSSGQICDCGKYGQVTLQINNTTITCCTSCDRIKRLSR